MKALAKGWEYASLFGMGTGPLVVWKPGTHICHEVTKAPAECFADAKPEEPLVEERTLHSSDNSFVMTVWLKDDPPRIEAQIVQQPEEWRCPPKHPQISIGPQGLALPVKSSFAGLYMAGDALFLRGASAATDNRKDTREFNSHQDRDAYLAKLEATVAAMPRLADQFKVGDRAVVAGHAKPDEVYSVDLPEWIGRKGKIERVANLHARIDFDDGNEKDNCIWLINLRHEREDERPAGVTISGDEAVAAMNPDPKGWKAEFYPTDASECAKGSVVDAIRHSLRTWTGRRKANLERYGLEEPPVVDSHGYCGLCARYYSVPGGESRCNTKCPLWVLFGKKCSSTEDYREWPYEKNPEPVIAALEKCLEQEQAKKKPEPPPRKYEDGQHIKTMQTAVRGTIERAEWGFGDYGEWVYYLWPHNQGGDSRWTVQESACVPCPPPLSDAQRRLQPGDKVRVQKQRWDADGKPIRSSIPPLAGGRDFWEAGTILRSWLEKDGPVKCAVRFGMGEDVAEYLWNLEPAEEK